MNEEFVAPETLAAIEARRRRDRRVALTVTIAAHLLLLAIFGFITVLPELLGEPEIRVTMVTPASDPVPALARQETARMAPRTPSPSASARAAPIITATAPAPIAAPRIEAVMTDAPVGLGLASGTGIGRGAFGQGVGAGVTGFSFMGVRQTGRSLVLVIDISGSMVHQRGGDQAYVDVEEEAIKTLQGLPQGTPFGIVMFAGRAHAFRDRLTPANPRSVQEAISFMKSYSPVRAYQEAGITRQGNSRINWRGVAGGRHSGTRTDLAMEAAFAMDPEAIILLSDGEPTGVSASRVLEVVEELQQGRRQPVPVSAVSYLSTSGRRFMQDLAAANDGEFRAFD